MAKKRRTPKQLAAFKRMIAALKKKRKNPAKRKRSTIKKRATAMRRRVTRAKTKPRASRRPNPPKMLKKAPKGWVKASAFKVVRGANGKRTVIYKR